MACGASFTFSSQVASKSSTAKQSHGKAASASLEGVSLNVYEAYMYVQFCINLHIHVCTHTRTHMYVFM